MARQVSADQRTILVFDGSFLIEIKAEPWRDLLPVSVLFYSSRNLPDVGRQLEGNIRDNYLLKDYLYEAWLTVIPSYELGEKLRYRRVSPDLITEARRQLEALYERIRK